MRKAGRRLLAGLASGALVLTGAAIVAAPQAQAVVSASVYCSGGTAPTVPGSAGVANDPTTVVGACSVPAGSATNAGTLSLSNNVRPGATWIWMNVSGSATIAPTPGGTFTAANQGTAWAQIDAQTIVMPATFADDTVSVFAGVVAPSSTTVTVRTTTQAGILPSIVGAGNTAADSEFPIAFYGTPATVVVSPLVAAIPPQFDDTGGVDGQANATWLSVVRALDSAGNFYPLNADDTKFPLTVELFNAPSANRDTLNVTGVPLATGPLTYDPFSVGIQSNGSTAPDGVRPVGTNEYTVRLTPTLPDLRASSSYVVSNTLGGSYTLSFDKASYDRGETATLTMCVNDLGGRIVPDGLDWTQAIYDGDDTNGVGRAAAFQFNAETVVPAVGMGFEVDGFESEVATSAGCDSWTIIMPSEDIDFTVGATTINVTSDDTTQGFSPGWAAGVTGPASVTVKVGDGGGPVPPASTIMIVGDRLDRSRVFVEGSTTNLAGATVTPYFRFPGQAPGMTMGIGIRTVDANGDFTWQRKTGKKITVDFRVGDVRSNKVIIPGR